MDKMAAICKRPFQMHFFDVSGYIFINIPADLIDDKAVMVQAMAWGRQATSH